MKRLLLFFLLPAILISLASYLFAAEAENTLEGPHRQMVVEPPADLVHLLQEKFPGSRIAGKGDYCKDFDRQVVRFAGRDGKWSYGLVQADFNGDKLDDYSVIIRFGKSYRWLGALRAGGTGNSYSITDFGLPIIPSEFNPTPHSLNGKICDGALVVGDAKELGNQFPFVGIESAGSAIQYYWKDGQWVQTGYEP